MLRVEKKVRVSGRDDFLFGPVVGGGKLFLGGHAELICLDAASLEEVWRRSLRCIPLAFAKSCLVVDEHSKVNAIGISEDGVELWQEPAPRRIPGDQRLVWRDKLLRLDASAAVASLPARESFSPLAIELPAGGSYALAGDTLIATTWIGEEERIQTDRVLAFDLASDRLLWDQAVFAELRALVPEQDRRRTMAGEYSAGMLTGGSQGPLLGRSGAWLFGLDRGAGRILWTQRLGYTFSRPAAHNGRVLEWIHGDEPRESPSRESWLVSVDHVTGQRRYALRLADVDPIFRGYQPPRGGPAYLDDLAVFTTQYGMVAAFKEETGELVWVKDLKKKLGHPVGYKGRVYFTDNDTGSVIAVGRAPSKGHAAKARGSKV
jgi:outer membrane protein assembly factor BamB